MLSGDREARLLFTTCPEMENNLSHGTDAAGEDKYLKASLASSKRQKVRAHISATVLIVTNLCRFLVLLCDLLKLLSASDTSQEPILDVDRYQGNPPPRSHKLE